MATLKDIKKRIKAVQSTRQITKAMKMVAAAKLRRAQSRMLEFRAYSDTMREVIASLTASAEQEPHPLLAVRPRQNVEVIVFTSDRGLCGAFNTNILKAAERLAEDLRAEQRSTVADGAVDVKLTAVGKKAVDYLKRRNIKVNRQFTGLAGKIDYAAAQEIARDVIAGFTDEQIDEVYVVYNHFVNIGRQEVKSLRVLPVEPPEEAEEEATGMKAGFIYEPSAGMLLESLLPKNVEIQVYRALLESQASEEAARMMSMENATKAANEMIDALTLKYNKARQSTITSDLMDIVGGVEALKT